VKAEHHTHLKKAKKVEKQLAEAKLAQETGVERLLSAFLLSAVSFFAVWSLLSAVSCLLFAVCCLLSVAEGATAIIQSLTHIHAHTHTHTHTELKARAELANVEMHAEVKRLESNRGV
jgi:hypothetical protein